MLQKFTAKDYMAASLVKLKADQDVMEAIRLLIDNGAAGAPVLDSLGDIIGWLSERDCIRTALTSGYDQSRGGRVEDFMSREVISVDAEDSIIEVAERFVTAPHKCYPVVEDNRLIGVICRRGVLRAIQAMGQQA